jgi:sporadic carbohydrate cluster protein (TIGR04323 family)
MGEKGYRGYVASRETMAGRAPQHVQNIVIRDYARRKNKTYLLSAVEYTMAGSYLVLEDLVDNIDHVDGLILYSIFMLPEAEAQRRSIYDRVLGAGRELHGAVEDVALTGRDDIAKVEDLFLVRQFLARQGKLQP